MPVWQQIHREIAGKDAAILAVALDMQGPAKPRRFLEAAGAEFVTVVDEGAALAELFGFKAVPNGLLIDESGGLVYKHFGGFDIRKPETAELVRSFFEGRAVADSPDGAAGGGVPVESMAYFQRGLEQLRAGDEAAAKATWREGIAVEGDNWNLRKQLWALEHPEKFYDGPVDFGWQKEQIKQGR